jgi:ABC-type sugar transport system substrate-binding protein
MLSAVVIARNTRVYYNFIGKFWMQRRERDLAIGEQMWGWVKGVRGNRAAAVVSYSLVLTVVMGCRPAPPPPGSGRLPNQGDLIVLIGPPESSPQSAGIAGGARRFIEQYPPLRLEILAPADNRSEALMQVVGKALTKHPKAICLYVSDRAAAARAAEDVVAHGVILVTLGVELDIPGVFGHVEEDVAGAAELLGRHLDEIVGGRRSYLLLHRAGTSTKDTHCYERFLAKARSYRAIPLLEERSAGPKDQSSADLVRAMFATFPHAGLVVTLEPSVWLQAAPADVLGQNARFATVGAAPALWGYLRSGQATALAGPLDGELGSLAVELALAAITESRKPGAVRTVRSELVTRETLDDFAKRYAEAAGLDLQKLLSTPASSRPVVQPVTP